MPITIKRILIILGTIIFALINVEIVVNPFQIPAFYNEHIIYFTIMTVFCVLIWYGWLEGDEEDNTFLNFLGVFVLVELTALINIETFPYPSILFWTNLLIWIILSIIFTDIKEIKFFDKIVSYSFSLFIATTAFITIGYHPIFSYSYVPIEKIKYINDLIDIRLVFGIVFILLIITKAVISAFKDDKPDLSTIESIDTGTEIKNNFLKVFIPIIIVIKLIINIIIGLINFGYLIISLLVIYLYRIGLSLGQNILNILSKSFFIFKLVLILTTLLFVAQFARELTPKLITYITSSTLTSLDLLWEIMQPILLIILSLFTIVFIISTKFEDNKFEFDRYDFEENLSLRSMGLTTVSVMLWLSGFCLFLLSHIRYLEFLDFKKIGLFNAIYSCVIIIGLVIFITKTIVVKKK